MKNILLSAILVLLSLAGYATSRGIQIINKSDCELNIEIQGSEKCPDCTIQYTSNWIVIPPIATVTFPNTTMLGGSFPTSYPAFINSVIIYSGPRHCPRLERWLIGDPKCGFPHQIQFYTMNQNCERKCPCLKATWKRSECDGIAQLIIEPC